MLRTILKSKIHRCRVTEANLYYEGSITIDQTLIKAAGLLEGEKVEVLNLNTGARLETYVIEGEAGSGTVCLNGHAARGACTGDEVIVLCYVLCEEKEALEIKRRVVNVDARNRIKD